MPDSFTAVLGRVSGGESLDRDAMTAAMTHIMSGQASEGEIGLFLTALSAKGETAEEVAGAATAMRAHMTPIRSRHARLLDTCGTGGGGSELFNVSTTAAVVIAAAGVPVAKHGNRSVTSRSGSADVLAELGVNIEADIPQVERCLDELGVCFCFAQRMHPAMRHVAAVRKKLGIRTIFNVLGPLSNPAGASHQLLGAGRPELRPLLASALAAVGDRAGSGRQRRGRLGRSDAGWRDACHRSRGRRRTGVDAAARALRHRGSAARFAARSTGPHESAAIVRARAGRRAQVQRATSSSSTLPRA